MAGYSPLSLPEAPPRAPWPSWEVVWTRREKGCTRGPSPSLLARCTGLQHRNLEDPAGTWEPTDTWLGRSRSSPAPRRRRRTPVGGRVSDADTPDCKPRSPAGPAPMPCHARTRPQPRPSAPPTQATSGFSSTSSAMLATRVCRVCRRFGIKTRWLRGALAVGGDAGRHATPWLCNREARVPAQGMASSVAATLRVPREPTLEGASRSHWRSERGAGKLRFRREVVLAAKLRNSSQFPPSFPEVGPRKRLASGVQYAAEVAGTQSTSRASLSPGSNQVP